MVNLRVISEADTKEMDRHIRKFEDEFAAKCQPLKHPQWRLGVKGVDDEPEVIRFVLEWDSWSECREANLEAICDGYPWQSMEPIIAQAKREALAGDFRHMFKLMKDAQADGYASMLAHELFAVKYRYIEPPKSTSLGRRCRRRQSAFTSYLTSMPAKALG